MDVIRYASAGDDPTMCDQGEVGDESTYMRAPWLISCRLVFTVRSVVQCCSHAFACGKW